MFWYLIQRLNWDARSLWAPLSGYYVFRHSCGGCETCLQVLQPACHRNMGSRAPSLESGWKFVTALTNRMWQSDTVTSHTSSEKAPQLLLIFLGDLQSKGHIRRFSWAKANWWGGHSERPEREREIDYWGASIVLDPSWLSPRPGTRRKMPLPDCDHKETPEQNLQSWVQWNPRCRSKTNDDYYFKPLFCGSLLSR